MDEREPLIDVDALVAEIRRRAEHARSSGGYAPGILDTPFDVVVGDAIRLRPEVAYSAKPVVGHAITGAKQTLIRGLRHVLDDTIQQINTVIGSLRAEIAAGRASTTALEARLDRLAETISELSERLGSTPDRSAEAHDSAHIAERLATLERRNRPVADPIQLRPVDPRIARLASGDASIAPERVERARRLVAVVAADAGIVDLASDGHEVTSAAEEYGLKVQTVLEPDGVQPGDAVGAVNVDPLAFLHEAVPGSLGGIASLGLGTRLAGPAWMHLADLLATRLIPGGAVAIEFADPRTPAGQSLRMRDPAAAPPLHPDTIAWILTAAGLVDVMIDAFGESPDAEGTPLCVVSARRPAS